MPNNRQTTTKKNAFVSPQERINQKRKNTEVAQAASPDSGPPNQVEISKQISLVTMLQSTKPKQKI